MLSEYEYYLIQYHSFIRKQAEEMFRKLNEYYRCIDDDFEIEWRKPDA